MIADDFSHKACVLGPALSDWESLDVAALSGRVRIDDEKKASGQDAAVMGQPLETVARLSNLLSKQGVQLNSGNLIMTGSVTPVIWLYSFPCHVEIECGGLGKIGVDPT